MSKLDFAVDIKVTEDKQHILWHDSESPYAVSKFMGGKIVVYREGFSHIELLSYDNGSVFQSKETIWKLLECYLIDDKELQEVLNGTHSKYYSRVETIPEWSAYYLINEYEKIHLGALSNPYLNEALLELDNYIDIIPDLIESSQVLESETIPFSLVIPEFLLKDLNEESKLELTRKNKVDYLVIKRKEHRKFYRYFKKEYLPEIGSEVKRTGNHYTSMGEGTYCYTLEDYSKLTPIEGRVIGILEGDVEYYKVVYDSGDTRKDLDNEVLIKPDQTVYLVEII